MATVPKTVCCEYQDLISHIYVLYKYVHTKYPFSAARRTPFYLRFRSDQYEFTMMDAKVNDRGFQLQFVMDAINCN